MNKLKISEIYEYPGLRHCSISDDSGEQFYHDYLNKYFKEAFEKKEILYIDLDDTSGYAPSFLDEAFGNLVYDFSIKIVKKFIKIKSQQEPEWKDMLLNETFPQWQERREEKNAPEITSNHKAWYYYKDGKILTKNAKF